jgi:hypothetical protein
MADTKTLTYADVAEHSSKKDLYVVIHDKVYNASSFVDEHPYAYPFQSLYFRALALRGKQIVSTITVFLES